MSERDQDLDWIRAFNERFWEERFDAKMGEWMAEKPERLDDEEFTRLHEIILRWDLPVQMTNTGFGFGVGLVIFEPEKPAIFPGTEDATIPDAIACVSQSHLPPSHSTFEHDDRIRFDDGWGAFEPLTHRDGNLEILRRCGLPEPRPKGDYVY